MEPTEPQPQHSPKEQHVADPSEQPQSRVEEDAMAGLARMNKRAREDPAIINDNDDEEPGMKRRQTLDSRDGAGAASDTAEEAAVEIESPRPTSEAPVREAVEQIESASEEATQAITNAANETSDEPVRRRRELAAYVERTSTTRQASYDDASTWNSSLREPSLQPASNGNPSTRQTSPQPGDNEEAGNGDEFGLNLFWVDGLSPPLSPYPASQPDSEYILPKSSWPVEHKNGPFQDEDVSWELAFHEFGTFMNEHPMSCTSQSEDICEELLRERQSFPEDSLFDDRIVQETCRMIDHRHETMLFRDITPLIAPSAEVLALRGQIQANFFAETTNEVWISAKPITRIKPQPTYAVGFTPPVLGPERYKKMYKLLGDQCTEGSDVTAGTPFLLFPFFSCEVESLSIARRQNTHNMTIAMRGVVELFRGVNRQAELHRQVLAFSISHNHRKVLILAHYPIIVGQDTHYFQKVIHAFDFSDPSCSDRFAAYRFTRNLYERWAPTHFERICSAIDDIPWEN